MTRFLSSALLFFYLANLALGVKREDFKTCSQSTFCHRNIQFAKDIATNNTLPSYSVLGETLQFQGSVFKADILNQKNNVKFALEVFFLENNAVRVRINEKSPVKPRYDDAKNHVLVREPGLKNPKTLTERETQDQEFSIRYSDGMLTATVRYSQFEIEFASETGPVLTLNERGLFNFEQLRTKEEPKEGEAPLEEGLWEDLFKGFTDYKKNGPSSIGVDVSFHEFTHVYGIPQHATQLSLKTTTGEASQYDEPYRLYNLDVFEYEIDNPMALYGSIPFMVAHRKGSSAGVFWLNSAEMWIDVEKNKKGSHTHWIAESGLVDIFVFIGQEPKTVLKQYGDLTGNTALPPAFSLGYHQCRWNYNDQKDVKEVDAKFDEYDIPYDVIWLDIEHTDGKRYFTWDENKFSDPIGMQKNLTVKGRKLVNIVDPHIKREDSFHVYKEATDKGYFVKDPSGKDFDGWCWPGSSSWVDYTQPEACQWWASLFKLDKYKGSTESLYVWNDMNEPSVFNGPEITMQKDRLHSGGWEHRDLHNLYGLLFHRSTANGLAQRLDINRRPFVLSRAFFPGTQRVGAIWTGDNTATWEHLKVSSPMLLSISLTGVGFSGADVGGFFGNPEPELLVRWYQAGAFQPFFRGHAHIDSKRREPWLFGEPYTSQIRTAIRNRYHLLPYWYTLFFQNSIDGVSPMRPMFVEFPENDLCFDMDAQYMIGSGLLVKPVTESGVAESKVYLPESANWYNYFSLASVPSGWQGVPSPADTIPVFLKGGSILPKRNRIRRSYALMMNDPISLLVALDSKGGASGHLYLDDGDTYAYLQDNFAYRLLTFNGSQLNNSAVKRNRFDITNPLAFDPKLPTKLTPSEFEDSLKGIRVEQVIIVGLTKVPTKVICTKCGREVEFKSIPELNQLIIKDPKLNAVQDWTLELQ